jgi:glycerol-3-phosphate dehydrogenase
MSTDHVKNYRMGRRLIAGRRAKAIEQELYQGADGGATCAELAAVLQEYETP